MLYVVVIAIVLILFLVFLPIPIIGKYVYRAANKIEASIANLQTKSIEINDIDVAYYDSGLKEKPALILIHGFSADRKIWLRFAKYFKQTHRVIIPDLLGHGDTPYSPNHSYSSLDQANLVNSLIEKLDLEKVSLVGNSMGGMISMILAIENKDKVARAVLLDPAGAYSNKEQLTKKQSNNPFLVKTQNEFKAFYPLTMSQPPFMPASVIAHIAQDSYIDKFDQLSHQYADFFDIDTFFKTPFDQDCSNILIIWGENDDLVPLSDSQTWKYITKQEPVIYKNVGHMPMIEVPKKTAKDVLAFL